MEYHPLSFFFHSLTPWVGRELDCLHTYSTAKFIFPITFLHSNPLFHGKLTCCSKSLSTTPLLFLSIRRSLPFRIEIPLSLQFYFNLFHVYFIVWTRDFSVNYDVLKLMKWPKWTNWSVVEEERCKSGCSIRNWIQKGSGDLTWDYKRISTTIH